MAKAWIHSRCADGGTYVLSALTECMLYFPDATDVIVMGDDDMTPFHNQEGLLHWKLLLDNFSSTKFHFIALGLTASHEFMESMALITNGIYKQSTYQDVYNSISTIY